MEASKKQSVLGILAMILGIIGMISSCILIGIIPCIISLILALITLFDKNTKKGMAISGLICSSIGILIFILMLTMALSSDDTETRNTVSNTEQNIEENLEQTEQFENIEENLKKQEVEVEQESNNSEEEIYEDIEKTDAVEEMKKDEDKHNEELDEDVAKSEISLETEEEYKSSCQEYKYKDVLRNPENYVGQRVKITVEISSVHEASWLYDEKYYFAYSEGEYGYFSGDRYAIIDKRYDNTLKLLDEDIIMVYGEVAEPEEAKSLIVNSEELFVIDMRYVELLAE